jgi:hypothetical protein
MKRKLIVFASCLFFLMTIKVFSQGLMCDLDFGCWLFDDWTPTIPSTECHSSTPSEVPFFASSSWTTGKPCPTDWILELKSFPYNYQSGDCYLNGCHLHSRILDPAQYQEMLTSSGGIKLLEMSRYTNIISKEDSAFFSIRSAKPEASGVLYILVKARIPGGADRTHLLDYNPGWHFENNDPSAEWMWTTVNLPYHILGLVELPNGDNYLKSAPISNHIPHNQYALPKVIQNLQQLAQDVRTKYYDYAVDNNGNKLKQYVKISFNDLSLEYGGILDYNSNWDCPHKLHRKGTSADLNTTVCLTCDNGQRDCHKSSDAYITLEYTPVQSKTLTVKEWIDRLARGLGFKEKETSGSLIHLEYEGN